MRSQELDGCPPALCVSFETSGGQQQVAEREPLANVPCTVKLIIVDKRGKGRVGRYGETKHYLKNPARSVDTLLALLSHYMTGYDFPTSLSSSCTYS
jgi:hypothetical protein